MFIHLLRWDLRLLQRYQIVTVSAIVTLIYILVFNGLAQFGSLDKLLILIIFNDPALLGFLFMGVMILFEKNENTLPALSTTPLPLHYYLLSKSLALTGLSLVCCWAMAWAAHGLDFHYLHFSAAAVLSSLTFGFFGIAVVMGANSFNQFILRALGCFFLIAFPFLGYFEITPRWLWLWNPAQPTLDLFDAAFHAADAMRLLYAYALALLWLAISYGWAIRAFRQHLQKQ